MTTNRSILAPNLDAALLVLRIALGVTMIAHGYQKVFTFGFAGVTSGFVQMGVPMATVTAPLIALLELFGGVAVLIGLLTRLAALGFVFDMLGAAAFVHFKNGFFLPTGFEFVFVLLLIAVTLMLAGAGRFSVDAMIAARRRGTAT